MSQTRVPAPRRTGRVAVLALAATAVLPAAPALAADAWTTPLTIGTAPANVQAGIVTRVGITSTGSGTVAWNVAGDGSIASRDFTVGGTLGTQMSVTNGSLVGAVARDAAGNAVVTGQTAGTTPQSWVATRTKTGTAWSYRTLESGATVNAPAAFGLKAGFLVAATQSFIPTSTDQGSPLASAFGFLVGGAPIAVGKPLSGVETGDFTHGADGSNWAVTSNGMAITTGRREVGKPSGGKAPKSVAALVKVGSKPTRNSILGAERFGGGSVSTVGKLTAIAGLDVQQTNEIAVRGIPVVALGEDGVMGETTEIGGVPDRRALEVDVAARTDGGAVVTWLQQSSSRAENLEGQPKWAIVDSDGDVSARGAFTTATDARDLRVVRAGPLTLAVWVRGRDAAARFYAARLDDDSARIIKAPAGTPIGHREANLNTSQLVSNGRQVALSFVDAKTGTVRVATQRLK